MYLVIKNPEEDNSQKTFKFFLIYFFWRYTRKKFYSGHTKWGVDIWYLHIHFSCSYCNIIIGISLQVGPYDIESQRVWEEENINYFSECGKKHTNKLGYLEERLLFIDTARVLKERILPELFYSGGQNLNLRGFWLNGDKI